MVMGPSQGRTITALHFITATTTIFWQKTLFRNLNRNITAPPSPRELLME
jgi:hypothetical protein